MTAAVMKATHSFRHTSRSTVGAVWCLRTVFEISHPRLLRAVLGLVINAFLVLIYRTVFRFVIKAVVVLVF